MLYQLSYRLCSVLYLIQNKRFAYLSQDFLPHAVAFALGQRYLPINSVSQSDNFGRFMRLRIALYHNPQNVVSRRD